MSYHIDAVKVSLAEVRKRMEETDLVPSRLSLLDTISEHFALLEKSGYKTLADLRAALKDKKKITAVSVKTGIDAGFLTLLRREIESWFPKAFPLRDLDWLPPDVISKLEEEGYRNSAMLFDALDSPDERKKTASEPGIGIGIIDELYSLVNLARIQWTSPLAARMLLAAGYRDAGSVAGADPEKLCADLERVNSEHGFFKGKIGIRDIRRLVKAASYMD